ncbi:MAG: electron transport complex subunit RsxC [Thiotrichaceae bacterium]|nr:electron transport complex subunit RsxC [Thiotrichaceae bacterium]
MHGGVHVAGHKALSTDKAMSTLALPERLMIPTRQHRGIGGKLLVAEGDYVYKGQPLTEQRATGSYLVHASTSGTIEKVGRFLVPHRSGYSCIGVSIKVDGKEDWGNYRLAPMKDFVTIDNALLLDRINDAGVVGLGGAVFPTAVKIGSGAKQGALKTLIINAAECEPYITCDDVLMRTEADQIVTGIQVMLKMLSPEQCLIGIEDNKPEAIAALKEAVAKLDHRTIKVIVIPTIYPSGDAKQLTKILTGVEIAKGKRSYELGILCHNVATAHSLYKAVVLGEPLLSRLVTVTGAGVKEPQNFDVLLGTPFTHLVQAAGGYTNKAERLLMGGLMMGYPMHTDEIPVVKATNCVLVLPESDLAYSSDMAMPCTRCGKCVEVCPPKLLPQQLYWHSRANDLERVQKHNLADCIECGCCSYVCPSNIDLVSYFTHAKGALREERQKQEKIDQARERFEFRDFRIQRDKEERDAKRAEHKAALQKKKAAMAAKKAQEGENSVSATDSKQDAIKAALARVQAKKKAQQEQTSDSSKTESKQD